MIKRKILVCLVLVLSFLTKPAFSDYHTIVKGVLDLKSENIASSKMIKLQGNVEFYWNQLLSPKFFADSNGKIKPEYVTIPKSWAKYKINGEKVPNRGFATYRFVILKDPDRSTSIYGLKITSIYSSYKLWANGKLLAEVGKVGIDKEGTKPAFKYLDIPIVLDPALGNTDKIEIIVQVSNFKHQRGGLQFPLYFSTYQNLLDETRWTDILNLIIFGIILVIGINHLTMYFLRRQDVSNLYFGIVCLVMILRNISTSDRIISYMLPNIGWELLFKLDNFSGFGTIPLFALFIYCLFKKDFPIIIRNIILYLGIAISIFVFSTPAYVYGKFRMVYEIYVLLGGLYITFGVLLIASIRKRPYAIPTFVGMFILYSTAINDVLSSMGVIQTAYIAQYGLVAFMFLQSVTINRKSAKAINENEILSKELTKEKESLEVKVLERTQELKIEHKELLKHQERDREQNWLNVGLTKSNEVLSKSKDDVKTLCRNALNNLIKYIDAKMGVIYIINKDDESKPFLELVSDYGCTNELKKNNARIPTDHGMIGACFTDKQMVVTSDIPDNFVKIKSGLGESTPKSLIIIPLTYEDAVVGVMEIASFNEFKPVEIELIKRVTSTISTFINTVKMNEENIHLIEKFRSQADEMREKEQRLLQNLEEMVYYREEYERLKNNPNIQN